MGIKFLIELDGKTDGAKAVAKGLGDVESAAEKTSSVLGKLVDHSFGGLTKDIFKAEGALHLLEKGADLAWGGVKKLGETVMDTINTAAHAERTKAVFENMLGDNAPQTLEYLDEFAKRTELGKKATMDYGAELTRIGYRGQEFEDAMAAISDSASLSTDHVGAAAEAMSALARMKLTGRVDARTMRGLGLDVREVQQGMAKALGMTPEAIKKGLEEGTIPAAAAFNVVLGEIEKKTGKDLGEASLNMGQGLEAGMMHLKEVPEKIMKGVQGSQGLKDLNEALDDMLKAFDPDSPAGMAVIEGLSDLIEELGASLRDVDWEGVGQDIKELIDDLTALIKPIAWVGSALAAVPKAFKFSAAVATGQFGNAYDQVFGHEESEAITKRHQESEDRKWHRKHPGQLREGEGEGVMIPGPATGPGPWFAPLPSSARAPLPDISPAGHAGAAAKTVNIQGARAEVTVTVAHSNASPEEIAHAARTGVHEALTSSYDQLMSSAGLSQ